MTSISVVAVGAVTVGINLSACHAELHELGLTPGGYLEISAGRMEELRQALSVGNIVAGEAVQVQGARLPVNLDVPGLIQSAIQIAECLDDDHAR